MTKDGIEKDANQILDASSIHQILDVDRTSKARNRMRKTRKFDRELKDKGIREWVLDRVNIDDKDSLIYSDDKFWDDIFETVDEDKERRLEKGIEKSKEVWEVLEEVRYIEKNMERDIESEIGIEKEIEEDIEREIEKEMDEGIERENEKDKKIRRET